MPAMLMVHPTDPAKALRDAIGDVSDIEVFNTQVLCAIYVRPEKSAGGIFLPDATRDEDKIQGKVGLVLKKGPTAFNDPEGKWFQGVEVAENDWVYFRPSDGWSITVKNFKTGGAFICRILEDTLIRGKVSHPDRVW